MMKRLLLSAILLAGCEQPPAPPQYATVADIDDLWAELDSRDAATKKATVDEGAAANAYEARLAAVKQAIPTAYNDADLRQQLADLKAKLASATLVQIPCPQCHGMMGHHDCLECHGFGYIVVSGDDPRVKTAKPITKSEPPKEQPKPSVTTSLQSAIDSAKASNRCVLAVVRQNVCPACDKVDRKALSSIVFLEYAAKDYVVCELNVDHDSVPFSVSTTPTARVYFPDSDKWGTPFTPSPEPNEFLNQLYVLSNGARGRAAR